MKAGPSLTRPFPQLRKDECNLTLRERRKRNIKSRTVRPPHRVTGRYKVLVICDDRAGVRLMRVCKILLLLILFFSLIGCSQEINILDEQDPVIKPANMAEKAPTTEVIEPEEYNTKLIFIKNTGENWLVVDERGLVHKVESSTVDSVVEVGTICENGKVIVNNSEYKVKHDYPYSISDVRKVAASKNDAPYAYATFVLNNFVYNGNQSYAISEYKLKDVEVKKTYDGRIDALMTFDVKPLKGAYWWGLTKDNGVIKDRQIEFTIYGAEGTWLSIEHISRYFEVNGKLPSPPQSKYPPAENQNVLFEDEEWSYYGDRLILPQTKELQEANIVEYIGTINRIHRQSGVIEQLYEGEKNYSYKLFAAYDNKLYILSNTWVPFSEGFPSYFGVLDLETNAYRKLQEGMVIRGTVKEEKGYLFADDKLIEVDLGTENLRTITHLPQFPNYSYGSIQVNYIIKGKMSFSIIDIDIKQEYIVDLETGNFEHI